MDGLVVYLNGDRGIAVLEELRRRGHGIMQAVVPPSALSGAVAQACRRLEIPLMGVANVNDSSELRDLKPRLGIIAGFSTLFGRPLIDWPEMGTINLHGGRLPQYRGGSPLNWQILNGESEAWLSVIRVDEGIDTGDVLADAPIVIGQDDTIAEIQNRAQPVFAALTADVVERFERGDTTGRRQNQAEGCYWHQRNDYDGAIRWATMTARQVHDLVRAITRPYRGAHARLDGCEVRIFRTELPAEKVRGVPGRIYYLQGKGPYVVCADGALLLTDYAVEGQDRLRHGTHLS